MSRRPIVTISFAQSLDGRVATRTGDSQWISGPETLHLAHELRAENDALLVGIGTVLADNPQLTCRIPGGRSPLRVVLDTHLRIPPDCTVVATTTSVPTLVYTSHLADRSRLRTLQDAGVEVSEVATGSEGLLEMAAVLDDLSGRGVSSLLVEGGKQVITSLMRQTLCSKLIVVMAPMIIGEGISSVGDLSIESLEQAVRGRTVRVGQMGQDVVWEVEF